MIAANDADDIAVRKALAERHLAQGDAAAAEKWAGECLYIDVYDPTVHVLLADAQARGKKFAEAIEEYQTALELKPKKPNDLKVKLAKAQLGKGDARRRQGHARRRPQGRSRASRGQGAAGGDRERQRVGENTTSGAVLSLRGRDNRAGSGFFASACVAHLVAIGLLGSCLVRGVCRTAGRFDSDRPTSS